ncbi:MAG: hypothetical protein AAGJ79_15035 [Verrucomicrobiota bacterium]
MRTLLRYFTTPDDPRHLQWILLGFLALVPLYLSAVASHGEKWNHGGPIEPGGPETYYLNDQKVYLRAASKIHEVGIDFVAPRQRTLGYSYLLAAFYDTTFDPEDREMPISLEWFVRAKTVNAWLSVVLLGVLGVFFARTLSVGFAASAITATAFLLYIFRASYTQPELLYWTLNCILFYLLWMMLREPRWWLGVASGVLAAAAFFVKAGTLPLIYLFIAAFGFKMFWDRFVLKKGWPWKSVLQGALVPLVFVLTLFPYLQHSWKTFGSPFYSTYSKHIMWSENKDEMYAVMTAGAAEKPITDGEFQEKYREHYLRRHPDADPASIPARPAPSAKRYFSDNSLGEAKARLDEGIGSNRSRMKKYYPSAWKFLDRSFKGMLIVAGIALVGFSIGARERLGKTVLEGIPIFLYVLGFFTGYLILYAWYNELGIGVRLMLSLYVPFIFATLWVGDRLGKVLQIPLPGGRGIYLVKVLPLILLAYAATKAHRVFTGELYVNYSGA